MKNERNDEQEEGDMTRRRGKTMRHPDTLITPIAQNSAMGIPCHQQQLSTARRLCSFFKNYVLCTYAPKGGLVPPLEISVYYNI